MAAASGNALVFNFNTNIRLQNVKMTGRFYVSATNPLYIDGDLDWAGTDIFSIGSGTINVAGSLLNTVPANGISLFTTSGTLAMTGTGNVCSFNSYGNFTINTSGTITFPSTGIMQIIYSSSARTFTYTAGTVVVEAGHLLRINADTTYINSGAIVWDTVQIGIAGGVSSATYMTGDFKCNHLRISGMREGSYTYTINQDYLTGLIAYVRPYNGTTITVYESIECFNNKNTYAIRPNSGTAYIDYQGTPDNMDISGGTFGAVNTTLIAKHPLVTWMGTANPAYNQNISVMNSTYNKGSGLFAQTY